MKLQNLRASFLLAIAVLTQGLLAAQAPFIPEDERVIAYVRNVWGVYSDIDLITKALDEPDTSNPGIRLKTKIGLFLLAIDIADKAKRGDYKGAVESGIAWTVPTSFSYVGLPWLGAAASFGYKVFGFGRWLHDNFDRIGLNGQFEYYFYYRDVDQCSHQAIVSDGCGMGLRDGWLFKPKGYQSGVPSTRGRLTPAEFFEIAKNLYDAARLDSARKSDEAALQRELREALNRTSGEPRDVADEKVKGTARIRPNLPKESEVEWADFRSFTFELGSTACGDAVQKITGNRTVTLRDGRYVAARSELLPDFHVAVAEKVAAYHDVDGDGRKEAVVMLFCGHALRSWALPVVFRLEGGRPSIVAYLEESHRALGGPAEANVEMSGADLLVSFQWNKRLLSDAYREMGVYRWVDGTLKRVH